VGLSDADANAFLIEGIIGTNAPSPTITPIELRGWKKNGATRQALADTEILLSVTNGGTDAFHVFGNGSAVFANSIQAATGFSVPGGFFTVDDTGAMLAQELELANSLLVGGQLTLHKGADLTAANDLPLGNDGNFYIVNGNTQINAIDIGGLTAGTPFMLLFTGTPTVKHNTAGGAGTKKIFLAGSTDFVGANNKLLTLVYDGTQIQEVTRKTP